MNIINKLLVEDNYIIQKFVTLIKQSNDQFVRKFERKTCPEYDQNFFYDVANILSKTSKNALFIDQVVYQNEDKDDLMNLLHEHITNNLVKV